MELVTESTKGVNNETLDDSQQDKSDEQEKGKVKQDSDIFIVSTIWRLNHITDTTTSSDTLVQMEDKASEHIVAFLVRILSFFTLGYIELPEEIEGQDGVDVTHNGEKTDSQHQLFAIVGDSLENDPQGRDTNSDINKMGSKEEVVEVSKNREDKVEDEVQEGLIMDK